MRSTQGTSVAGSVQLGGVISVVSMVTDAWHSGITRSEWVQIASRICSLVFAMLVVRRISRTTMSIARSSMM